MRLYKPFIAGTCFFIMLSGCQKDFLTIPPSTNAIQPNQLPYLAGMLNNSELFCQTPVNGEASADGYYVPDSVLGQMPAVDRQLYTWEKDIYAGQPGSEDWRVPYKQVYTANVVLDELEDIASTPVTQAQWNQVKGTALFMRAYAFHQLAMVFAPWYNPNGAEQQRGIVLSLSPEQGVDYTRSNLRETYARITADLLQAKDLVPVALPDTQRYLPDKAAVCAALARVYLLMSDYDKALSYCDSALGYHPELIDYNTIKAGERYSFSPANKEVLYNSSLISTDVLQAGLRLAFIDTVLYRSYSDNDLRKYLYYKIPSWTSEPVLKGSYSGKSLPFSGLATDELYLTRAECYARRGNIPACLNDINTLLLHRYKPGTFVPCSVSTADAALSLVLTERRKELAFRGLRWSDLKRINGEGRLMNLQRIAAGQLHTLPANSNRWVLPIPDDALQGSHIDQNPRD